MASANDDERLSSSSSSNRSEDSDSDDQRDVAQTTEHPQSTRNNESTMPKKRIRLSIKISKKPQANMIASSNGEESNAAVSAPQSPPTGTAIKKEEEGEEALESSSPPKKRIKLVIPKAKASQPLKKLASPRSETAPLLAPPPPLVAAAAAPPPQPVTAAVPPPQTTKTSNDAIKKEEPGNEASVLEKNHEGEDDVVAAVVAEPVKKPAKPTGAQSTKKGTAASEIPAVPGTKKKTAHVHPTRSVRLPPMSSPGLLIPPGIYRGPVDANGLVSPNVVFTEAMDSVGYNLESRTNNPHRGSSVQRVVDDMFDSNVKFCPNFPCPVPEKYLKEGKERLPVVTTSEGENASEPGASEPKTVPSLAESLLRALEASASSNAGLVHEVGSSAAQARGVLDVSAMFPLSLTLPYPKDYIERQQEYAQLVDEREKAIVVHQEDAENIDIARERSEVTGETYAGPMKSNVQIPTNPMRPEPCKLDEMKGINPSDFDQQHPHLYPRKGDFVDHLDKRCFHITEGRYFGLTSNGIADAHFVGPNAPGIGGLHQSSTSGLATANSSAGGLLFSNPSLFSGAKPSVALGISSAKSNLKKASMKPCETSKKTTSMKKKVTVKKKEGSSPKSSVVSGKKSSTETKKNGPTVTATYADLRKIMEAGDEESDKMRMVIIKAAVHAARAGKFENRSFRAVNRKVYPDVARAFSNFSGLKPCAKCKGNKQGTYSCRFRRKHDAPDYDGGDSWEVLGPLFSTPIGDLVIKPLKKKESSTEKKQESG